MFRLLLCAAGFVAISSVAFAEDCSQATLAEFREINDTVVEFDRTLRKLVARADGQDFRAMELSDEVQATLPPRPEAPVLAIQETDTSTIVCNAEGEATDAIVELQDQLVVAEEEISAFEALIVAREEQLAAAEAASENQLDDQSAESDAPSEDEAETAEAEEAAPAVPAEEPSESATAEGESATGTPAMPMQDSENPALFRRVISLPDADLRDGPAADEEGAALPTFSVLYVYDENSAGGASWLQVGDQLRNGPIGWIEAEASLPWSSMLVMQFTPRGQRERVLFFKDATPLSDIVNSPFFANEARDIYAEVETEKERLAQDPEGTPNWNANLVAIEPETAVTFSNEPYLLPILDWREDLFDGLTETTLLQVAAIPAEAETVGDTDTRSFTVDTGEAAANDDEFRVGMVFVMDTTVSMSPFIDRTRQVVNEFYDAFGRFETTAFVSFGLVGFRDSIDHNSGELEYVTSTFQPLDPEAPARQVLTNLERVAATDAPTLDFKEDVYAGLTDAIEGMDWSPYDARIIILVTDASSRSGQDPLLRDPGSTAETVAANANAGNIAIIPLHLLTPVNQDNGDAVLAEDQFRTLGETGDTGVDKYLALDATSDERFIGLLRPMAQQLARDILTVNSGDVLDQVEFEPVPTLPADGEDDRLARIVTNEIFRAQLESLAQVGGGDAPAFLAGWASDRDMIDPSRATLEVSVFLTRNQLSTLDKQLDSIVGAFRSGGDDPQAFFNNLQVLAAEMSTDPDAVRADDSLAVQTLMPTFLQNLPYKSEVLRLDRDYWSSLSNALREEFIEDLEAKQKIYRDTFNQTDLWNDFGSDDPGLEATLILLKHLP